MTATRVGPGSACFRKTPYAGSRPRGSRPTDGARLALSGSTPPSGRAGAFYRNAEAMVEQARHVTTVVPNLNVKMPTTPAVIAGIEEATYRGISVNATVSFMVPQAIAVGEAVERGLNRREADT